MNEYVAPPFAVGDTRRRLDAARALALAAPSYATLLVLGHAELEHLAAERAAGPPAAAGAEIPF